MCTKEDEPWLWLCVSLGACPGTCSKAVFAAKDLSKTCPWSWWDAWSSSKLELLRLVPELKQWWLCLVADISGLLPAWCWALTFPTGKECRQPLCSSSPLLLPPHCPKHCSSAEAVATCPALAPAGHTCVLDWPEWDCCSWQPAYFPPTARWVHRFLHSAPWQGMYLKRKVRPSLSINTK